MCVFLTYNLQFLLYLYDKIKRILKLPMEIRHEKNSCSWYTMGR